jgi:hypothetical protein
VTPVFKKGDVYDMKNYRPISLLNLASKYFEKNYLSTANQLP